jgi:hypothetical protein
MTVSGTATTVGDDRLRVFPAPPARGTDAQHARYILEAAGAERNGSANLMLGHSVAQTNKHGGSLPDTVSSVANTSAVRLAVCQRDEN